MKFYDIMKQAAAIGGALEMGCPNNDCLIYRNTFRMYTELRRDYIAGEDIFSETTKRALRKEARRLGGELEKMFFENHAIQDYKAGGRQRRTSPATAAIQA